MLNVQGNRDAIDSMAPGSARVMEGVLKLIDAYNLYGCVAYPKRHSQTDISDIYLLAAATKGVFVNPALQVSGGSQSSKVQVVTMQAQHSGSDHTSTAFGFRPCKPERSGLDHTSTAFRF